jgi:hypothetical protein
VGKRVILCKTRAEVTERRKKHNERKRRDDWLRKNAVEDRVYCTYPYPRRVVSIINAALFHKGRITTTPGYNTPKRGLLEKIASWKNRLTVLELRILYT